MDNSLRQDIYNATSEFIDLLNAKDSRLLSDKFGISEPVSLELFEILGDYFDEGIPSLNAPPIDKAFADKIKGKIPFEIYEMNEPGTWGVDCSLWSNEIPVEPILHLQF